jgi:hypothetical protein
MYPLRLKHKDHGYHYVYNPTEEEAHRAIGWGDEDAATQGKPELTTSPATPAPVVAAPKRRGRPRKDAN